MPSCRNQECILPIYHFLGALTTDLEKTTLASPSFFIRCFAFMPVRSVTGVASIMLSNASLSPMSEPDSESESMGTVLAIFSGGFLSSWLGFENGFDASTLLRRSAISSSSSSSSEMASGLSVRSTPPSSSSSPLLGASESSSSSSSESIAGRLLRFPPFQASCSSPRLPSLRLSVYSRSIFASQSTSVC